MLNQYLLKSILRSNFSLFITSYWSSANQSQTWICSDQDNINSPLCYFGSFPYCLSSAFPTLSSVIISSALRMLSADVCKTVSDSIILCCFLMPPGVDVCPLCTRCRVFPRGDSSSSGFLAPFPCLWLSCYCRSLVPRPPLSRLPPTLRVGSPASRPGPLAPLLSISSQFSASRPSSHRLWTSLHCSQQKQAPALCSSPPQPLLPLPGPGRHWSSWNQSSYIEIVFSCPSFFKATSSLR